MGINHQGWLVLAGVNAVQLWFATVFTSEKGVSTVAILAQGTQWAVALAQACFDEVRIPLLSRTGVKAPYI